MKLERYVSLYVNNSVCTLWNIFLLFRVDLRLVLQENKPAPGMNAKHIYQFVALQYYSPFSHLLYRFRGKQLSQ